MKTNQHKLTAVITLLICLIVNSIGYARTKEIYIKTDTDREGYSSVVERHEIDNENNTEHHTLLCNNPGLSACTWEINPSGRLINYAKDKIKLGILSGQHQIQENLNTYTVIWGNAENGDAFIKEIQNINDPLN